MLTERLEALLETIIAHGESRISRNSRYSGRVRGRPGRGVF